MAGLKVRARAVDMLGRQQIAGIPTAIHELFKNAHDAYAQRMDVDFFRRNRLVVLRDDGLGMTREEVEGHWLTLGTESRLKANDSGGGGWTGPDHLPRRVVMGEKGIGRLAIAVLAPLTLMLTRAIRPGGPGDLVAVLVHWGLFEQPGIDLQQVHIPIHEFPKGTLPDRTALGHMITEVRDNIHELAPLLSQESVANLLSPLESAAIINPSILEKTLNQGKKSPLFLSDNGHGTWFFCLPVASELDHDIDHKPDEKYGEKGISPLQKILLGFANAMEQEHRLLMETSFWDRRVDGDVSELISGKNFFNHEDFDLTDHIIEGQFDPYGQFRGTIRFYDKNPEELVCSWVGGKGRPVRCGPFRFKIGVLMGNPEESHLKSEDHKQMQQRMGGLGGLYVYRDGIRILPYGTWDHDFLGIEHRRTLSASDWFYSYRRMFGFVALSHSENRDLSEKAGREGFRENMAFRDFRDVLENLFKETAVRYFRGNAPEGDDLRKKRDELKKEHEQIQKRKRLADQRRKDFKKDLKAFRDEAETGGFHQRATRIKDTLQARLEKVALLDSPGEFFEALLNVEREFLLEVASLNRDLTLVCPNRLALGRLEKEWEMVQRLIPGLRRETVEPLEREIGGAIATLAEGRIDATQRLNAAMEMLESGKELVVKDMSRLRAQTIKAAESFQAALLKVIREETSRLRGDLETLIAGFARQSAEKPEGIEARLVEIEKRLATLRQEQSSLFDNIRGQLEEITGGLSTGRTMDHGANALENRLAQMEEQMEFQAPFVQIGMTIGILGHEFELSAAHVRKCMHDLKPWADTNKGLMEIYLRFRQSFEYLEGHLRLLDPLGRRLVRRRVEMTGNEIKPYLMRIFMSHLDEAGITLSATPAFEKQGLMCRGSSLLGAMTNLVDNAIYWSQRSVSGRKVITLDADGEGFLVRNSGPGISEFDAESIFDFGWSSRPNGRGMGLAVSRRVLAEEDLGLELITAGKDIEPVFKISPLVGEIGNEGQHEENC